MAESRIPAEHLDILKKSGILNPDVTLEKLVTAADELDKSFAKLGAAKSVPTLIGSWYVYHTIQADEVTGEKK